MLQIDKSVSIKFNKLDKFQKIQLVGHMMTYFKFSDRFIKEVLSGKRKVISEFHKEGIEAKFNELHKQLFEV